MSVEALAFDVVVAINQQVTGGASRILNKANIASALARPLHTFGGTYLTPAVASQAAALLEGLVAGHGFSDGNKRTAWVSARTFLRLNGITLAYADPHRVADFVEGIAIHTYTRDEAATWMADHLWDRRA